MFKPEQLSVPAFGKGWLAVDKPSGMSVHNDPGQDLCDSAFSYIQTNQGLRNLIKIDPKFGIHPVHRLDRETSGIILLAVDREIFRFFSTQFKARQVKKKYVALLHGLLENHEEKNSFGKWCWPLSKTAGGRKNPQGTGSRQHSETLFRVIEHSIHYTMVNIEILTGRRHQIRRHAKLAGHPVVGDGRYGSTRAVNFLNKNFKFNRLALHAHAITLKLPDKSKPETIQSLSIPDQIKNLFKNDRSSPAP